MIASSEISQVVTLDPAEPFSWDAYRRAYDWFDVRRYPGPYRVRVSYEVRRSIIDALMREYRLTVGLGDAQPGADLPPIVRDELVIVSPRIQERTSFGWLFECTTYSDSRAAEPAPLIAGRVRCSLCDTQFTRSEYTGQQGWAALTSFVRDGQRRITGHLGKHPEWVVCPVCTDQLQEQFGYTLFGPFRVHPVLGHAILDGRG